MFTEPEDACLFTAKLSKDRLSCVFTMRAGEREIAFELPREDMQRLLLVLHHAYAEMRRG